MNIDNLFCFGFLNLFLLLEFFLKECGSSSKKSQGKGKRGDDTGDNPSQKHHSKKKSSVNHEAVMNMKRKRLYVAIGKKEIGRVSIVFQYYK